MKYTLENVISEAIASRLTLDREKIREVLSKLRNSDMVVVYKKSSQHELVFIDSIFDALMQAEGIITIKQKGEKNASENNND